jgi:hypothetical protein
MRVILIPRGSRCCTEEAEMRARIKVLLVLVASVLLAGSIGIQAATGQTVLHLIVQGETQKVREVDHDANGLSLGDRAIARGPLTDSEGMDAGTSYADCLLHRRITRTDAGLWNCTYVLELADGDLILQGLDPRGPGTYEMAVLGGTGAYASASGDATFTDTFDESYAFGETDMMIRLSN